MMEEVLVKLNVGLLWLKLAAFNKKRSLFTSTLDLDLGKKLVKCTFGA
jgi:hypothetical protein